MPEGLRGIANIRQFAQVLQDYNHDAPDMQPVRPETFVVALLRGCLVRPRRRRTTHYGRKGMVAKSIDKNHTFCDHATYGRERLWYSRGPGTIAAARRAIAAGCLHRRHPPGALEIQAPSYAPSETDPSLVRPRNEKVCLKSSRAV